MALYKGFYNRHPLKGTKITLLFLNIIGLPPLSGFYTKFLVLDLLLHSFMFTTIILKIVLSLVSSYYYLNCTIQAMVHPTTEDHLASSVNWYSQSLPLKVLFTLIVFIPLHLFELIHLILF